MKTAVKSTESAVCRRGPGIFLTETPLPSSFPPHPFSPTSGPVRRLPQGPTPKSKLLAAVSLPTIMKTPKYSLGQTFSREGKCSLEVYKTTADGKYVMCKVLRAVRTSDLALHVHPSELQQGATIILPGNRKRLLLGNRGTGYWDWTNPDDLVVMTEDELNELRVEAEVRHMPREVARILRPGR